MPTPTIRLEKASGPTNDVRPRILVIDDEAGFTKLLKLAIRKYNFREVNDSAQALGVAREFRPDLILLDVIMPGADGGDVAAQLGRDPVLRQTPIIFVTAIVSSDKTTHGALGDFEFLPKPVDPEKLIAKVDALLLSNKAARNNPAPPTRFTTPSSE